MGAPRIDFLAGLLNPFGNPDLRFFQRRTSQSGVTSDVYTADRFKLFTNIGVATTWSSAGGPGLADVGHYPIPRSLYFQPGATTTPTLANRAGVQQFFEGTVIQNYLYRRVKFGFIARTNKAGDYTVSVLITNSAGNPVRYLFRCTMPGGNVWTKQVFEVDLGVGTAMVSPNLDSSGAMTIDLLLAAGPDITNVIPEETWTSTGSIGGTTIRAVSGQVNFYDSTSNTFEVTGWRMTTLDYEGQDIDLWAARQTPYDVDLQFCQRYYEKSGPLGISPDTATGNISYFPNTNYATTSAVHGPFPYKVRKRAIPTVTFYDNAGNANRISTLATGGASTNNVTPVGTFATETFCNFQVGAVGSHAGFICQWAVDAEL